MDVVRKHMPLPTPDMVPDGIKETYEKLGIPEAERKYLAGVTAQYESEVVYHRNREDLEGMGVLFCDMDTAVREHPGVIGRIEDLERDVGRVQELGGTISQEIFEFPGGRRFHIVEPAGTEFAMWTGTEEEGEAD